MRNEEIAWSSALQQETNAALFSATTPEKWTTAGCKQLHPDISRNSQFLQTACGS